MQQKTSSKALLALAFSFVIGCAESDIYESDISTSDPLELRRHVAFLASDDLLGREAGEPGVARAEDYIAQAFKQFGLEPLPGQADFFVPFTLFSQGFDPQATRLQFTANGERHVGLAGTDFRPFSFSAEGTRQGEVVFAGYGITAPEHHYDDYKDLDVEGKFVLIFRHEPGENDPRSPFDGQDSSAYASFVSKAQNAEQHGAAGMILVTDPTHQEPDDLRIQGALRLQATKSDLAPASADDEPFLAVHIRRDLAENLFQTGAGSLVEFHQAMETGTPASRLALAEVTTQLTVARHSKAQEVTARNVAGFLAGSDPKLKNEWIVIGGHHDHEGGYVGDGDTVFNGADDNASGTSAVLALARLFTEAPRAPARSLVFVTFSAEEKGLLGSRALVKDPALPHSKVAFMLNLDMIGRNPDDPIQVFGDGYVRGLREIVEQENATLDLNLTFAGDGYAGNSDHDSFYRQDIPFMFFFTGVHEDYHQLGDHAEKLDYERMESIVRLASGVVGQIASQPEAPTFIHNIGWLGARLQVVERTDHRAVKVTTVTEDSRAAKAGLEVGDTIVAVGEKALENPKQIGQRFRDIKLGTGTELTVRRGENKLTIAVERARVGFLGVFPGPVDTDLRGRHGLPANEGVMLRGVNEGGPAAQAGLQDGDILLRISGRPVSMNNLRNQLRQIGAGEKVKMMILRGTERQEFAVTLGQRPNG